jgi:hypothetical protein
LRNSQRILVFTDLDLFKAISGLPLDFWVKNRWHVDGFWVCLGGKSPHSKILMHYGVKGYEGSLFREEVRLILSVMADRLSKATLKKHVIAPVSALTFPN